MMRILSRRAYLTAVTLFMLFCFLGAGIYFRDGMRLQPISRHILEGFKGQIPVPVKEGTSIIDVPENSVASTKCIPNLVHYVWIVEGRPKFRLDLLTFISIYSSHIYFKPDIIYIHTDATPKQWAEAKSSIHPWTTASLNLPSVRHNLIVVPYNTTKGVPIENIKHRSDFIRVSALMAFGGIYMDMDVLPLRDIAPLRHSGFANIFGNEEVYRINNGIMMAKPGSALMRIYAAAQHDVFDNLWTTHSVDLLTDVAYRLQAVPFEVLVLGKESFSPSSWTTEDIGKLFETHDNTSAERPVREWSEDMPVTFADAVRYWDSKGDQNGREDWENDYSGSYLIHAFDGPDDKKSESNGVNLRYFLARKSNLARAAYPAVKHAIDAGIIKDSD